jgi:hypothetical protein
MSTNVRSTAVRLARQALDRMPPRLQYLARRGARQSRMLRRRFGRRSAPLVSLVVPVYGVERYLPACLDSLIEQTHPRLQIILIDDGSPDRSIDIMGRTHSATPESRSSGRLMPVWARPAIPALRPPAESS